MDFVDDIDLIAAGIGREKHLVLDLPDILHRSVGGAVYLYDIQRRTGGHGFAGVADSAGLGRRAFFAVERLGQDAGRAGLAAAPGAGKKVGVGDTARFEGLFEGCGDKLLSRELLEGLGSFSCRGDFVGHGFKNSTRTYEGKALEAQKARRSAAPHLSSTVASFRTWRVPRRLRAQCLAFCAQNAMRRERDLNPRYPYGYTRLPIAHLRPLGHLSKTNKHTLLRRGGDEKRLAERGGFEPPEPMRFNGFRDRPIQPLSHLSKRRMRLRGFEPPTFRSAI